MNQERPEFYYPKWSKWACSCGRRTEQWSTCVYVMCRCGKKMVKGEEVGNGKNQR